MSQAVQQKQEAKAEFLLGLRARGISDLAVLRAMETVPRAQFVPHRHADLANRDMALPIECGQTMPEPYLVARMAEALALGPGLRVLEIGAGSGYATAVLARLCGQVVALERFQTLAIAAMGRLERLGIENAEIVWADGLALGAVSGLFDRILIHAVLEKVPGNILAALGTGGVLVAGGRHPADKTQWLFRLARKGAGGLDESWLCPSRLRPLIAGISRQL